MAEALDDTVGAIDEILLMLKKCSHQDTFTRVAAVLAMMRNFDTSQYKMVSAVAIEHLSQFMTEVPLAGDVPNAEQFLIKLMSGFIMSSQWAKDTDRPTKIQAMSRAIFTTCTPSQSALLSAVAMMRLIESGQGPVD